MINDINNTPPRNPNGNDLDKDYLTRVYTGKSPKFHDFINILRTRREINDAHIKGSLGDTLLSIFKSSNDKDEFLLELLDVIKDTTDKKYILSIYRKAITNGTIKVGLHSGVTMA